jgi:hypothetical protein
MNGARTRARRRNQLASRVIRELVPYGSLQIKKLAKFQDEALWRGSDNQETCSGRVKRNMAPPSSRFSAQIRPPVRLDDGTRDRSAAGSFSFAKSRRPS